MRCEDEFVDATAGKPREIEAATHVYETGIDHENVAGKLTLYDDKGDVIGVYDVEWA